jgi:hypothetical protein
VEIRSDSRVLSAAMQEKLSKQFVEVEMRLCKRLEQLKQDVMEFKIDHGVN